MKKRHVYPKIHKKIIKDLISYIRKNPLNIIECWIAPIYDTIGKNTHIETEIFIRVKENK